MDRQRLFECLRVPPEYRTELVQTAYTTMGAVNEVAVRPVTLAALHAALRQGIGAVFGVDLVAMPISPEEWRLAQQLRATKYTTDAWNLDGAAAWRHHQRNVSSL
jgi:lipoate-protein ligase A